MEKPTLSDSAIIYDDDEFRHNYDHLPEWLQKKIDAQVKDDPKPQEQSREYADLDDEVPF
jgi:hypothetical protein